MNRYKLLKYLRRLTAAFFGAVILLAFLDLTGTLPEWVTRSTSIQIVPALMHGLVGIVVIQVALAFLFGRIYCSVLCPLGILQDFIYRLKKWAYLLTGRKKKLRTRYQKPQNLLRFSVLGITIVSWIAGSAFLLLLLDPYSNFGRIAAGAVRPLAIRGNNLLADLLLKFDVYSVYHIENAYLTVPLVVFAMVLLLVLTIMVWTRERLWCNTVCPVGTFLGVFSRYSLFAVRLDPAGCTGCTSCEQRCKARCIDMKSRTVDASRCVACFDCLDSCRKSAIHYKFMVPRLKEADAKAPTETFGANVVATKQGANEVRTTGLPSEGEPNPYRLSRRRFIQGSAIALTALPFMAYARKEEPVYEKRSRYPLPPGASDDFKNQCTACQLCVTKCPMQVIRPGFLEHGLTSMMQPLLYFQPHCYCNYDCTVCGDVCPNDALKPLSVKEKRLTQMGVVHFVEDQCVVKVKNQDCGACAEHCPTQAVHMVPYKDGLTIPSVSTEVCVGCGACESICPVRPLAIFVEGHRRQVRIDPEVMRNFRPGEPGAETFEEYTAPPEPESDAANDETPPEYREAADVPAEEPDVPETPDVPEIDFGF